MFNHPTQSFSASSGFNPAGTLERHCPSIQEQRKGYGGFAKKSTSVTMDRERVPDGEQCAGRDSPRVRRDLLFPRVIVEITQLR